MNKFIKLPLFLGATCLVAGGLLAGVVAITDPIIEAQAKEKLAKAYQNMYVGETITVGDSATLEDAFIEETNIQGITKVTHDSKNSTVYKMKSKSAYESLIFFVGISDESKGVDSYYCLEASTSSLGYGNFKDSSKVTSLYNGYDGSGSPTNGGVISGTTKTSNAVKAAIDSALADYKTRNW